MTNESAHVRAERRRLQAEHEAGMTEGYDANINAIPEFFHKPYYLLTARQRGYIFGRELKIQERNEGQACPVPIM